MEQNKDTEKKEVIRIDGKSKVLFAVLGVLIAGSVAVAYYKYMIKRDYIIQAQTDCDPETENCFIWECDPDSLMEGEACTGVPDNDIWYYKNVERNASRIPLCDPNDENCDALVCAEGEPDCREILCTSENVPEGETCNNPQEYLLENPPEAECEEGDEECLSDQEAVECEEGDEECLSEKTECDSEDPADCADASADGQSGEECAPDDEKCLEENAPDENADNPNADQKEADPDNNSGANIPPPGAERM
jgi:hypothetical protein